MNQNELTHLLDYNPDAGIFTWKNPISTKYRKGDVAGSLRVDGYVQLKLSGKPYLAHRLAWLYVHGSIPAYIDHINQNRSDNRLENLREASKSQNGANRERCKNNATGYKGVIKKKSRYVAALTHNKKRIEMGHYATPEQAWSAYQLGAYLYHGEFASW